MLFLIWGVIQLIASIFIWFAPGLGAGTLMAVFGVWAMLTGMVLLVGACTKDGSRMSPRIQGVIGVLGILAGIYLVVEPGCGAPVTIWSIGTSAIAWGMFLILASLKIRSMRNQVEDRLAATLGR
ncbi:MAG: hypothetical protein E6R14_10015 [Thermomicrobiales bacterium]|nr:MAG: hypothetical protein E6R14_10015 [Thermomicrobiales bacterium]